MSIVFVIHVVDAAVIDGVNEVRQFIQTGRTNRLKISSLLLLTLYC